MEISNRNAVFLSWGLPGRTSQLFLPHLVLRFFALGATKAALSKTTGAKRASVTKTKAPSKNIRFPASFSWEAWVSGDAKRQKMGINRLFRDLRLEISNRNAAFLSKGLPGRTSELFFPHLVLRFSRSGAPNQRVQKPWHPWLLFPCKRLVHRPVALTW